MSLQDLASNWTPPPTDTAPPPSAPPPQPAPPGQPPPGGDNVAAAQPSPPDEQGAPAPSPPPLAQAPAQPPQQQGWQVPKGQLPADIEPEQAPLPPVPPRNPPGTPQWPPPYRPPPRGTTYYPAMPNRPHTEWGKDDFTLAGARNMPGVAQGPFMPRPWEIPGIYMGVGRQLGQFGSGYVRGPALAMSAYSSSYMKGFAQGQALRQKLLHDQMSYAAEETSRRQQEELQAYGEVMAIYKDKPDEMRQHLLELAQGRFQDDNMKAALDQGGTGAAERLLAWRNAKWTDTAKSRSQQQKEEHERDLDAPHMRNPTDETGAPVPGGIRPTPAPEEEEQRGKEQEQKERDDNLPGLNTPDDAPAAPTAPTEGTPVGEAQPQRQQLAMEGGQLPMREAPLESNVPSRRMPQQQRSQALDRAYEDGYKPEDINGSAQAAYMRGGVSATAAKGMSNRYRALVEARQLEIGRELDDIRRTANGSDVYARANRVLPPFGDQLKNYVEGRTELPKKDPMLNWILALGQKADPTFSGANAQQRKTVIKEFTVGQTGRLISGMSTANGHIDTALRAVDEIERYAQLPTGTPGFEGYQGPFLNRLLQFYRREAPDWAPGASPAGRQAVLNFQTTIHLIAPEIARAQKNAAPTLREIQDVEESFAAANSPPDLRRGLLTARHLFHQRAESVQNTFRAAVGRDPVRGIEGLLDGIQRSGSKFDPGPAGTESTIIPGLINPNDTYGGAWRRLLKEPDPGPQSITAPAPAAAPAPARRSLPSGWGVQEIQ